MASTILTTMSTIRIDAPFIEVGQVYDYSPPSDGVAFWNYPYPVYVIVGSTCSERAYEVTSLPLLSDVVLDYCQLLIGLWQVSVHRMQLVHTAKANPEALEQLQGYVGIKSSSRWPDKVWTHTQNFHQGHYLTQGFTPYWIHRPADVKSQLITAVGIA